MEACKSALRVVITVRNSPEYRSIFSGLQRGPPSRACGVSSRPSAPKTRAIDDRMSARKVGVCCTPYSTPPSLHITSTSLATQPSEFISRKSTLGCCHCARLGHTDGDRHSRHIMGKPVSQNSSSGMAPEAHSPPASPTPFAKPMPRPPRSPAHSAQIRIRNRRREYLERHPDYFKSTEHELAGKSTPQ